MYLDNALIVLATALLFWGGQAHGSGRIEVFGIQNLPRSVRSGEQARSLLEARQTPGTPCGTQNGGQSCPAGQCCSQDGHCGTGRAYCDAPYCQFEYGPGCDANTTPTGQNTSSVLRPKLGSVSYGSSGILKCSIPGTAALTYDDGPYIYTSQLLDILKTANVTATFFITGTNYGKHGIDNTSTPYPGIIRRMHTDGHQIGSHTWSHQDLNAITHLERMDQMIKNEMAFRNILGFFPTYMRPPFDSCETATGCRDDIANLGYHIIEYNVDTYDYENLTPDTIQLSKDNVTAGLKGHSPSTDEFIIYAHDTHPQTVTNLTQFMIDTLKNQGYRLVTIGECLNDPRENWYRNASTGQASSGTIISSSPTSTSTTSSVASASSTGSQATGTGTSSGNSVSSTGLAWTVLTALALVSSFFNCL